MSLELLQREFFRGFNLAVQYFDVADVLRGLDRSALIRDRNGITRGGQRTNNVQLAVFTSNYNNIRNNMMQAAYESGLLHVGYLPVPHN